MALKHHSLAQAKVEIDRTIELDDAEITSEKANKELDILVEIIRRLQSKVSDGSMITGTDKQIINRLATLQVVREIVQDLADNIKSTGRDTIVRQDPADNVNGTAQRYLGDEPITYGLGAKGTQTSRMTSSVNVHGSLVESYNVITRKEDAVQPDPEADLLLQAYHEMAESLRDRLEGEHEDLRELDVQTSENTPAIKLEVKGYVKSPGVLAAKAQEDAVTENPSGSYPLPIPDKPDAAAVVEGPIGWRDVPADDPELAARIEGAVSDFEAEVEAGVIDPATSITQQYVVDVVSQNIAKEIGEDEASTELGAKVEGAVERFFLAKGNDAPPVLTSRLATGELTPGTENYMVNSSANPKRFG